MERKNIPVEQLLVIRDKDDQEVGKDMIAEQGKGKEVCEEEPSVSTSNGFAILNTVADEKKAGTSRQVVGERSSLGEKTSERDETLQAQGGNNLINGFG